ncbi:acyl-CoA dehydrogenase family protein [Streptomyces sp. NPDC057638]|uniref:acyl-CoA dehydrogenase family protein n=1 Tax=Streptomyces sp. NPDC057638 TaxID=3346190 RepID=UPI00369E428C
MSGVAGGGVTPLLTAALRDQLSRSARTHDAVGEPDRGVLAALRSSGVLGTAVPRRYGGAGRDMAEVNRMVEEIAAVNPSVAIIAFQHCAVTARIMEHGTDSQRRYWLPRLADGSVLAASAWSESGAGAAKQNLATRGRLLDGGQWLLDGAKTFTTGAGVADVYLVLAQTTPPPPSPPPPVPVVPPAPVSTPAPDPGAAAAGAADPDTGARAIPAASATDAGAPAPAPGPAVPVGVSLLAAAASASGSASLSGPGSDADSGAGAGAVAGARTRTGDGSGGGRIRYGADGQTFFLVEATRPGLRAELGLDLTGMRASATGLLSLNGVPVPDTHRLGPTGQAARIIAGVRGSGATLAAVAAGIAQAAFTLALDHARRQRLLDRPQVTHRLADLATRLASVQAIVAHTGARTSADPHLTTLHSKLHASTAAEEICLDVARMLGSAGYRDDAPISRLIADARGIALMGPTNDLCRDLVAASWT